MEWTNSKKVLKKKRWEMQNTRRFGTIRFEMGSHIFIFEAKGVVDKKVLIVLHKCSFRCTIHATVIGL
jgi:hypothetical protein